MRPLIPLLCSSLLLAQVPGPRAEQRKLFRENRAAARAEDGPLAGQLHSLRVNRLQEVMGLPQGQARQIADRWATYDREFMDNARRIQALRGQFNQILVGPGGDEDKSARLKPLIEQFLDHRRRQADAKNRFEDDIRAQLSPAQQARLIMLVENMTRRIQEVLMNRPAAGQRALPPGD
jgi:hypothetical protein